jgi:AraC-like DNA-binding protein
MKLYIKNMVCGRCKTIVKDELDKMGIKYISVELGEAVVKENLSVDQHCLLSSALMLSGLELLTPDRYAIVENLKKIIVDLEYFSDENLNTCYSDLISSRLRDSFVSLNTMFSEIEGITIEKYIINHKIELVKELLIYNKMTLNDIAHKMHYSSTAKLSSQFKSITGLTPLHFKQLWFSNTHFPESN